MTNDNEPNSLLPPIAAEPHPDFPGGCDLDFLLSFREGVINLGKSMGLKFSGCGIGIDGADITFKLGDQVFQVQMELLKVNL